ncbi:hypothetical protein [Kosakonia cowanii]|uniref:hypothetical protein n=1 Tax=Kosakonia cowanii TaxID=208223 RepID=UPI001863AAFA|nr:hypothetical protein [Kosakonia cowanii]
MLPQSLNNNAFLLKAIKNSSPPDLPIKYSAGSASGKTVAIILNNHIGTVLQKNKLSTDLGKYSIFPPQTIFRSNLANYLGSKNFFTSVADENDEIIKIIESEVPTLSLSINDMTKDEIVEKRRVAIDNIYHRFSSDVIFYLKEKYL